MTELSQPTAVPSGAIVALTAEAAREYVAAAGSSWAGLGWRSLRWTFDDVTDEFGSDVYERMLRDPQVLACLNVLKAGILEDGVTVRSAIGDESDPQFEAAAEIAGRCRVMFDNLNPSLDETLWSMLDALALGHRVAEIVWAPDMQSLRAIKVKPRDATAFVVDVFNNVVGLLARVPGRGQPVAAGTFLVGSTVASAILPREKFAVLSWRAPAGDPRGASVLRPAYNAWWLKMQTWPQYLKFLVQFGTPSIVGTTPAGAEPVVDTSGAVITPEQTMLDALLQFQNGTAVAFPFGSTVDTIDVASSGMDAFVKAFDLYDRQITTAILHQTLATMEGQHQARAASETHLDVLNTMIRQAKRMVCRMIERDVLCPFLRYAIGPEAEALCPAVSLGSAEQVDVAALWNAAANLARAAYFDPSQYPALDELLNLPPRQITDPAEQSEPPMPDDQEDETDVED